MNGRGAMKMCVRGLIGGALLLSTAGCSLLSAPEAPAREPVETAAPEDAPFVLRVVDEMNDGASLHVLANIEARTPWDPRRVLVRLTGLRSGEIVGVRDFRLGGSGGAAASMAAGQVMPVSLSIPVAQVTDYQLELLWGEEAGEPASVALPPLTLQSLAIRRLPESCPEAVCRISYEVSGELRNNGRGIIYRAALGVGFAEGGQSDPDNEEQVELGVLALQPGQSRPIRLVIDQTMPRDRANAITPTVRVLSFDEQPAS